ncbi:LamG domain-containing protein [Verrucomicrobium spinosum]|uniref:LamG domain-containing protein n=1 Tax=Verrucomicrobium spinosum TaxID=2736 RepID=UPI00094623C5|nr:LamG domain-containing protein [Verrucomicrobium spinosum]
MRSRFALLFLSVPGWLGCAVLALLSTSIAHSSEAAPKADAQPPVAHWKFEGGDVLGVWQGKGFRQVPGPQGPGYPTFAAGNQAMELAGQDAALVVPDRPELRFQKGNAITIEMWVKVRKIREGQIVHLMGKGRNGTREFGDNNQNYGLRLRGGQGSAAIGFIFTSAAADGQAAKWHRWWSNATFQTDTGWHHLAVTYTFGKKDSLRGYIDGVEIKGAWDLGGATDAGPVHDGDTLVIGTGYTRGTAETLDGWLDEVAIHRTALSAATLKTRFAVAPAPAPEIDRSKLPGGRVLVELCEKGVPQKPCGPRNRLSRRSRMSRRYSASPSCRNTMWRPGCAGIVRRLLCCVLQRWCGCRRGRTGCCSAGSVPRGCSSMAKKC